MDGAFHIIQVTDIDRPAFEDQRDSLREDVAMGDVNDEFNEKVQRLIDESFAADDLQSVAEDLSLSLEESDWLARDDEGDSVLLSQALWSKLSVAMCWKKAITAK